MIKESDVCLLEGTRPEAVNDTKKLKNQISIIQKQLVHITSVLEKALAVPQINQSYADVMRKAPRGVRIQHSLRYATRRFEYLGPQQETTPRKQIECWQCGKLGHISRFLSPNNMQKI